MIKRYSILLVLGLGVLAFASLLISLPAPQSASLAPTVTPASVLQLPPAQLPQTDGSGNVFAYQEGPLWVLISGVDDHGLLQERRVTLLSDADPAAESDQRVRSGTAAAAYEVRVSGPQNLWRFYRVHTVSGESGWVSDFYVRRRAYLYNDQADNVALYDAPDGSIVAQVTNVSPVRLIDPTLADWWQVESADGSLAGWVPVRYVKESSAREFLLVQQYLIDSEERPTPVHTHVKP